MGAQVELYSFGYLHNVQPVADLLVDARRFLHDPSRLGTELGGSDGRTDAVQMVVLRTPGAPTALSVAFQFADSLARLEKPCVVAVGCSHGRHRSVALVELVAEALTANGHTVAVRHLRLELLENPAGRGGQR